MSANEMTLKDYVIQRLDKTDAAMEKRLDKIDIALEAHRRETNARFDTLATRDELERASASTSRRIRFWTRVIVGACTVGCLSIGAIWKVVWDSIPHVFNGAGTVIKP